ncbi:helix-turn-helix transcriptional regulator [Brevibacillus centrosporus]|uniref:Predicted ATPase n=1 Tax=Brevibacillus centrosporus TaxID=54910 RepID=A0A1I4D8T8_9BACL|nr:AAA family ATPase [Brevibacillus centrosporus]SFK89279.1 Predicted ATPase [Brevibacillus centrosporus]
MAALPGYALQEVIYQSEKKRIYRALRSADGKSVIIKALNAETMTTSDTARLLHEYDVAKHLPIKGIVKPLTQEQTGGTVALIMEDTGGISLKAYLQKGRLTLPAFFRIAIQLSQILMDMHRHGVVHKDLKPDNIIINEQSEQVSIIDFSHAIWLKENRKSYLVQSLEGSLPYMSPEQTGRMNRAVDSRSDLYSLGIIFYEMLTAQSPFHAETKLDWIHAHMAKKPIPPHEWIPELPIVLSDMTMKLLAKTAAERYQTAYGLMEDLVLCHRMWEEDGEIRPFVIGQKDASSVFQLPPTLYGRENEIAQLRDAYKRAKAGGAELVLVRGFSGIGKTELIKESYRLAASEKAYFISGKWEQLQQEIPFAPLIQAFQDLVRQILTESSERIAEWKRKLQRALGRTGAVVTEVIPEIKLLIGEQPSVEVLPSAEAQNRFQLVFRKFVQVFSNRNHPLILFLDDLQWADQATLHFIRLLFTEQGSRHLLVVGAYRENEVSDSHPLLETITDLEEKGIALTRVQLGPLTLEHVHHLIAQTLSTEKEHIRPLAEVMYRKTAGNPFYFKQLFQAMYKDHLLLFNFESAKWEWDLEEMDKQQSFGDVMEWMLAKMEQLPDEAREILMFAGSIGNRFDLYTLSRASGFGLQDTLRLLEPVISEGLVLVKEEDSSIDRNTSFEFLHDRVLQTAYLLISEDQRKSIHARIGRAMLELVGPENLEERIYQIVHHLNIGKEEIKSADERKRLAELNFQAGMKAKATTAYFSALAHFRTGMELLSETDWDERYALIFQMHLRLAECEYLCTHYEKAEEEFGKLLNRARDRIDRAEVYRIRISLYTNLGKYVEAIQLGLQGLEELGTSISVRPSPHTILFESLMTRGKVIKKREQLLQLPNVSDPTIKATMKLIMTLVAPTFFANKEVFVVLTCRYIQLALKYGNTDASAMAYASFGLVLSLIMRRYKEGDQLGEIAMKWMEQFPQNPFSCQTLVVARGTLSPWVRHPKHVHADIAKALQLGLERGDFIYASYAMGTHVNAYYVWGSLQGLEELVTRYLNVLQQLKDEFVRKNFYVYLQLIRNLQGKTDHRFTLSDDQFSEEAFVQEIQQEDTQVTTFFQYYTYKTQICYLFGDYQGALSYAEKAAVHLKYSTHLLHVPELVFYQTLAITAGFDELSDASRQKYGRLVKRNIKKMKKWAADCPDNFVHKYRLMEAEKARLDGRDQDATDLYDQAIQSAKEQQYVRNQAIACELAASFYGKKKKDRFARAYITEAIEAFGQWGATEKVRQLRERYPELCEDQVTQWGGEDEQEPLHMGDHHGLFFSSTTTHSGSSFQLDLETFQQALLDFSKETDLPKLLVSYLETAMKNAGAETGFVLLEKDGDLRVEAGKIADALLDSANLGESVDSFAYIPASIVHYVARTRQAVVLSEAECSSWLSKDPYVVRYRPRSILCVPILYTGVLVGVLYLENSLTPDAFHTDRLEFSQMLSAQMASAKLLRFSDASVSEKKEPEKTASLIEPLTDREQEILLLIAEGLSNQEIAERLILTVGTVKSYIVNLYGKLQVNRRVQAVSRAKELGLLKE